MELEKSRNDTGETVWGECQQISGETSHLRQRWYKYMQQYPWKTRVLYFFYTYFCKTAISWIQSRALGTSFDPGLQWLAVNFVLLFWLICETAEFCLYCKMKGVPFLWFMFAVFYCCSLYNVWSLSSFLLFFV